MVDLAQDLEVAALEEVLVEAEPEVAQALAEAVEAPVVEVRVLVLVAPVVLEVVEPVEEVRVLVAPVVLEGVEPAEVQDLVQAAPVAVGVLAAQALAGVVVQCPHLHVIVLQQHHHQLAPYMVLQLRERPVDQFMGHRHQLVQLPDQVKHLHDKGLLLLLLANRLKNPLPEI